MKPRLLMTCWRHWSWLKSSRHELWQYFCGHWSHEWSMSSSGKYDWSRAPVIGLLSPYHGSDLSQGLHFCAFKLPTHSLPIFKSFKAALEMWHMTNCRDCSQMLKQKISMNPPSPPSTIWLEGMGRKWRLCRMSNESSERIVRGRANRLHEGTSLRDFCYKVQSYSSP